VSANTKEYSMIVVIENQKLPNGDFELRVSHGIDKETGMAIALPKTSNFASIGAWFNSEINEWVI
jgi:hypothetical protein